MLLPPNAYLCHVQTDLGEALGKERDREGSWLLQWSLRTQASSSGGSDCFLPICSQLWQKSNPSPSKACIKLENTRAKMN